MESVRRERDVLGRLYVEYAESNDRHFAGLLPTLPIRVETIAKRKADVATVCYLWTDDYVNIPRYLVFDRNFALTESWTVIRDALIHEMIHVWQVLRNERDQDHGAAFKRMAKRLGISDKAVD